MPDTITLDRYTMLNCIDDIWAPKYSTHEVYIACWKVSRSKFDIKLRFSRVNDTDEWAGVWYISKATVLRYRKRFDNNGAECYAVPLSVLKRLITPERSEHDLY